MNQILSTEPVKRREPMSLKTTMIIFGICMIIFGVCLISTSSYAVYKSIAQNKQMEAQSKPEINVNDNEDNTVTISATHQTGIKDITYSWNNEEEFVIDGNNQISVEETVDLPGGTNTLTAIATAGNGQSIVFEKEYTSTEGTQIDLSVVDTNIKISVSSKSVISFVTYKWDDEEEKTENINDTSGEVTVEIPAGQHTLTVTAVDENNNTQTKTQEVKGVTKPKLEVTQDGANFNIKVEDATGLDKVEFILNGNGYRVRLEGATEKQFSYPLEDGENTLQVTVYNTSGETNNQNVKCTK